MFYPVWKYRNDGFGGVTSERIETAERLAELDETWADSPQAAEEQARLSVPAEAERLALLAQEELALTTHLTAQRALQQAVDLTVKPVDEEAVKNALAGITVIPKGTDEPIEVQVNVAVSPEEGQRAEAARIETEEEELDRLERETRPSGDSQK